MDSLSLPEGKAGRSILHNVSCKWSPKQWTGRTGFLATDEAVEFEKQLVQVQDCRGNYQSF